MPLRAVRLAAVVAAAAAPLASARVLVDAGALAVGPRSFRVETLREVPHEGQPFTQGLEVSADGQYLVESSGGFPAGTQSFVRTVDPTTGHELHRLTSGLEGRFAEGIVQLPGGSWFLSTYEDKELLEFSPELDRVVASHPFPYTGWGFTRSPDGRSFLATNGSEYVMSLDRSTLAVLSTKTATCLGKRVAGLNELEMVEDFLGHGPTLLGNLYETRIVLALDPATGQCLGTFTLSGLSEPAQLGERSGYHVANGLAYNQSSKTLWVTGKNWAKMFEVQLLEEEDGQGDTAKEDLRRHLASKPDAASFVQLPGVATGARVGTDRAGMALVDADGTSSVAEARGAAVASALAVARLRRGGA